jgi:hypothetical protein
MCALRAARRPGAGRAGASGSLALPLIATPAARMVGAILQ